MTISAQWLQPPTTCVVVNKKCWFTVLVAWEKTCLPTSAPTNLRHGSTNTFYTQTQGFKIPATILEVMCKIFVSTMVEVVPNKCPLEVYSWFISTIAIQSVAYSWCNLGSLILMRSHGSWQFHLQCTWVLGGHGCGIIIHGWA